MNLFTLFMIASPLAGGVGAIMAARPQAAPSPLLALVLGLALGAAVHFGVLHVPVLVIDLVRCKKEQRSRQVKDYSLVGICLMIALLPVISGVSAYWLVDRIW